MTVRILSLILIVIFNQACNESNFETSQRKSSKSEVKSISDNDDVEVEKDEPKDEPKIEGDSDAEVSQESPKEVEKNLPPVITSEPQKQLNLGGSSSTPQAISLKNWKQDQFDLNTQPPGEWQVNEAGTAVIQKINSDPSVFIGDFKIQNSSVQGSWYVASNADDDDFMGFVFGYQQSIQQSYVFEWKQSSQNLPGGTQVAQKGMRVRALHADSPLTRSEFWGSGQKTDRVTELFHNDIGYKKGEKYGFKLDFAPGHIKITVTSEDQSVLADIELDDKTYSDGLFGFYNFSQGMVTYEGFEIVPLEKPSYKYQVKAYDPEGEALVYELTQGPPGMTMDATGKISWKEPIAGDYPVSLKVSDPEGLFSTQEFVLNVSQQ